MKNLLCPNCGAPIRDTECAFCGTVFYDFSNIEIGRRVVLRIPMKGELHLVNAVPTGITVETSTDDLYANDWVVDSVLNVKMNIEFEIVKDEDGVMCRSRRMS